MPALQAAPVLRPVGKAFGVQLRVGHCPNVLHRLRTLLPGAAASQGAQSNDDTTAGEAAPPPRLIVSPPVPISQVGANALMVHSNAVTMLGVVGAVAQRQAQAVVCLHQCLTFGEQGEPPRFEFSFVVRVGMHYTVVACQSAGASFPACCRFGHARTGRGNKPYTTIRVRQAQKSLHRRSHKGGRGGGLMSARRASRRLTGGAPGIPGNNNQPPRRQQRVSVAGRLSFRSRRLPDAVAGPSASSSSAHTAVAGDVLGAKHDAHRVVPAGRNTGAC